MFDTSRWPRAQESVEPLDGPERLRTISSSAAVKAARTASATRPDPSAALTMPGVAVDGAIPAEDACGAGCVDAGACRAGVCAPSEGFVAIVRSVDFRLPLDRDSAFSATGGRGTSGDDLDTEFRIGVEPLLVRSCSTYAQIAGWFGGAGFGGPAAAAGAAARAARPSAAAATALHWKTITASRIRRRRRCRSRGPTNGCCSSERTAPLPLRALPSWSRSSMPTAATTGAARRASLRRRRRAARRREIDVRSEERQRESGNSGVVVFVLDAPRRWRALVAAAVAAAPSGAGVAAVAGRDALVNGPLDTPLRGGGAGSYEAWWSTGRCRCSSETPTPSTQRRSPSR